MVLPAPFGPRRPVIPAPRLKLMSLTATTLPYQRDARSRTIGADEGGAAVAISGVSGPADSGDSGGFDRSSRSVTW